MARYDDEPEFALIKYFAKKYNLRVSLYDVCAIRLAFERGQTEFDVKGSDLASGIPQRIPEIWQNLSNVLELKTS